MIDKTFEENGLILEYDESKKANAKVTDLKKFIKVFPSKIYLFNKNLFTDTNTLKVDNIFSQNSLIEKYKDLEYLDNLFELLSIEKLEGKVRSYKYELFYSKKIIVDGYIDYEHLKKVNNNFLNSIKHLYIKFSQKDYKSELEKKFLLKALEDVFKNKKELTFNDIIDNWENICEEYEIIQRAYIESLDTQKLKFDYEKKLQEMHDQLYSILNNLQNKIIIPPLAIVAVVANIYNKPISIKLISILFLFIFIGIITNYSVLQLNYLSNIEQSFNRWKQLYKKHISKNFSNKWKQRFEKLESFIFQIRVLLIGSNIVFWLFTCIIFVFFIIYSKPNS